jgi:hypothetical protein
MVKKAVGGLGTRDEIKAAVIEVLVERPEFMREAVEEALEDAGLLRAIEEARHSPHVSRDEVFRIVRGTPCKSPSRRRLQKTSAT